MPIYKVTNFIVRLYFKSTLLLGGKDDIRCWGLNQLWWMSFSATWNFSRHNKCKRVSQICFFPNCFYALALSFIKATAMTSQVFVRASNSSLSSHGWRCKLKIQQFFRMMMITEFQIPCAHQKRITLLRMRSITQNIWSPLITTHDHHFTTEFL